MTVIGDRDDPIHRMVRYHLGWVDEHGHTGDFSRGKGLRSTLCLLACETIAGDHHPALPAAAIAWVTALTASVLPERNAYPALYDALGGLLDAICSAQAARQ